MKVAITGEIDLEIIRVNTIYNRARERWAKRAAAIVRLTAKRSIRKRKKASPAGSPPSTHEGSYLRNVLVYAYDEVRREAVVGVRDGAGELSLIHEEGREATLEEYSDEKSGETQWFEGPPKAARWKPTGNKKRVTYPRRPFLMPALEKTAPKLAALWQDSIK